MLLEFKIENYKSFREETTFSMIPAPKQTDLDYSILSETVDSKKIKALCSSVVYGPNAAGKTNLIGAMEVFQAIVSRGHIRNVDEQITPNSATSNLEIIPNQFYEENHPVVFSISFIEEKLLIQYSLSINLGRFNDEEFSRTIEEESLKINDKNIFHRILNTLQLENPTIDSSMISWPLEDSPLKLVGSLQKNLNSSELFLSGGFKNSISVETAELVIGWITKKFEIIYRADLVNTLLNPSEKQVGNFYIDETVNQFAKFFGSAPNKIGYVYDEEQKRMRLVSEVKTHEVIPSNAYESLGTIRLVNIVPLLIKTFLNGGTILIDEFDASIHPMAIMNIINIFHNEDINKKHAQLIFNTHNPIFLNRNLFRRDEIKFVDRSDETHDSELYSLADFGTVGECGVRKSDDYMKNYFINRYGAIRNVDFSPIFEKIMSETEKK